MGEERIQRRLAAILATDVVGYSGLMVADEARTLAQLKTLRKEVFDPRTDEHNGRIVKTTGDGVLVEYDKPSGREYLSQIYPTYDDVNANGYANLNRWIDAAAIAARR